MGGWGHVLDIEGGLLMLFIGITEYLIIFGLFARSCLDVPCGLERGWCGTDADG